VESSKSKKKKQQRERNARRESEELHQYAEAIATTAATTTKGKQKKRRWELILPEVLVTIVFDNLFFVALSEYTTVCLVCKHWNRCMNTTMFWKKVVEKKGYGEKFQKDYIMSQQQHHQHEDVQAKYWKKMYKEWFREEKRKELLRKEKVYGRGYLDQIEYACAPKDSRRKTKYFSDSP